MYKQNFKFGGVNYKRLPRKYKKFVLNKLAIVTEINTCNGKGEVVSTIKANLHKSKA